MRQDCYFAPRSERWVISFLANSVALRLMSDGLSTPYRHSLMRLLFGLQRFPRVTPGLNVNIEWADMETACMLRLTDEYLSIERGHTCLQYFVGSHHVIDSFELPKGAERANLLENWLPVFNGICTQDTALSIEDYSVGDEADTPPLNEQWSEHRQRIYFDSNCP